METTDYIKLEAPTTYPHNAIHIYGLNEALLKTVYFDGKMITPESPPLLDLARNYIESKEQMLNVIRFEIVQINGPEDETFISSQSVE